MRSERQTKVICGVAILAAIPLLVSNAASPSPEAAARKLRDAALADHTAYSIVRDLTTLFGPRPAGSAAEKNAAEWCARTMKTIGLKNVRIESFPLAEWRRGIERGEIVGRGAQALAVTALGGTASTPEGGVEGEVVLFPTLEDLRAAARGGSCREERRRTSSRRSRAGARTRSF
jgi:hypothetical protein